MKKYKGCVYFLRHIGLSPIKIGMSNSDDLSQRINAYKTASPYGIELLGTIPTNNALILEKKLHKKFEAFRLNGEWFEISDSMVNSMITLYSNKETIEKRNKIEEYLNSSLDVSTDDLFDYEDLMSLILSKYSFEDKNKGFIVMNLRELCNNYSVDYSRSSSLSRFMKRNGFHYSSYSYKNNVKKGFKLYFKE